MVAIKFFIFLFATLGNSEKFLVSEAILKLVENVHGERSVNGTRSDQNFWMKLNLLWRFDTKKIDTIIIEKSVES